MLKLSNLFFLGVTAVAGAAVSACSGASASENKPDVVVHWQSENLPVDSTGVQNYKQTFIVTGNLSDVERLCFNQFNRPMEIVNPADTLLELVPNYHAIASPRFKEATPGDTLVFEIMTKGSLISIGYAPGGMHVVDSNGNTRDVEYTLFDISADPKYYATESLDRMPYGDMIYEINEAITQPVQSSPYDIVPSFKSVELTGGESTVDMSKIEFNAPERSMKNEEYEIIVADNKMKVYADKKMWARLDKRLTNAFGSGSATLPNAKIIDWPTLPYRGVMIDIARNFQKPEEMRRVIDLMATYGFNILHFHPVDDESWRIEIPALPELAELGSRHGYGFESGEYLPQIYTGNGNPDDKNSSSNGYFTRQDYIDMIKYADSLGIVVLPEIESPGHARAAVKAMDLRAKRTGDPSWLLYEPGSDSDHASPQAFRDNVMNPALEGTYKLMDIVTDAFIEMHKEAGVPLPAIHIGGDEIPHGAWDNSKAIAELKEKEGLTTDKDIHAYFVKRVSEMLTNKGVKLSGWQEVALDHADEYNKLVQPTVYSINCWNTSPVKGDNKVANGLAAAGYPIVLSNVQHFYLDMTYSYNPEERGLNWGGPNDEFSALHGYPALLCTAPNANIVGVSGHTWSETIRGPETLETMLLPKILGLAERGWNTDSTYSDPEFHAVVLKDMPKWDAEGYTYHVRQPGIKLVDDGSNFVVNSPYPDAIIRYTLDGSKPTENSAVVKPGEKVPVGDATHIRATLWINDRPSVTTLLLTKK